MTMDRIFEFCPACGRRGIRSSGDKRFECDACRFVYFHNVAAAVAAIIEVDEEILLTERKHPPQAGKLDLPGGFVDPGESAEQALRRELLEELNITVSGIDYRCSFPNTYIYKGVPYRTTDLFFRVPLQEKPALRTGDDISNYIWTTKNAIPFDQIAFESIANGLRRVLAL